MEGLEGLRGEVDRVLRRQGDAALQREGWIHLYGVSACAALLAHRRCLNVNLCAAAGLMHDIYTFRTGAEADHAQRGAGEAAEMLRSAGGFSEGDMRVVTCMIQRHSDKQAKDGPYEECLKDADVLAHWLYDPMKKFNAAKKARLIGVFGELGFSAAVQDE